MKTLVCSLAAGVLLGVSGVASAELNTCDIEVTRGHTLLEAECYANYGPTSGRWNPRGTPELESCLDRVSSAFKIQRLACHGIIWRGWSGTRS